MQNKIATVHVEFGKELEFTLPDGWMVHSFVQCGFSDKNPQTGVPSIMFAVMLQRDDSGDKASKPARNPIGGIGPRPAE